MECQSERIKRLGNPDHIWYGQSDYAVIHRFPCLEHVTLPATYARLNICARCGLPFKDGSVKGLDYAVRGVVKHTARDAFEVYHPDCVDTAVPFVHDGDEIAMQLDLWSVNQ